MYEKTTVEPLYADTFIDSILCMTTFIAPNGKTINTLKSAIAHRRIGKFYIGEPIGGQYYPKLHQPHNWRWVIDFAKNQQWSLIGFHIALDIGVASPMEAFRLGDWIGKHLDVPHRRGSQPFTQIGNTSYGNKSRAGINPVCYSNRPSKFTGDLFCAHLETRFRRWPAMNRVGVRGIEDLPTLDLGKALKTVIRFVTWDESQIGRIATGRGRAKRPKIEHCPPLKPWDADHRAGSLIARFGAMSIRRACSDLRLDPARIFQVIDPPWTLRPPLPPTNHGVRKYQVPIHPKHVGSTNIEGNCNVQRIQSR